jgi:hypothetical protein
MSAGSGAVKRFRAVWHPQGKDLLLVYSNSPNWQQHVEEQWLPKWRQRAVVLNWLPTCTPPFIGHFTKEKERSAWHRRSSRGISVAIAPPPPGGAGADEHGDEPAGVRRVHVYREWCSAAAPPGSELVLTASITNTSGHTWSQPEVGPGSEIRARANVWRRHHGDGASGASISSSATSFTRGSHGSPTRAPARGESARTETGVTLQADSRFRTARYRHNLAKRQWCSIC